MGNGPSKADDREAYDMAYKRYSAYMERRFKDSASTTDYKERYRKLREAKNRRACTLRQSDSWHSREEHPNWAVLTLETSTLLRKRLPSEVDERSGNAKRRTIETLEERNPVVDTRPLHQTIVQADQIESCAPYIKQSFAGSVVPLLPSTPSSQGVSSAQIIHCSGGEDKQHIADLDLVVHGRIADGNATQTSETSFVETHADPSKTGRLIRLCVKGPKALGIEVDNGIYARLDICLTFPELLATLRSSLSRLLESEQLNKFEITSLDLLKGSQSLAEHQAQKTPHRSFLVGTDEVGTIECYRRYLRKNATGDLTVIANINGPKVAWR